MSSSRPLRAPGAVRRSLIAIIAVLGCGWAPAHCAAATGLTRVQVYATYYGWYDNTPPGCATSYSGCAGGSGAFADPITFASDTAEFAIGTELYYPAVHKYFRMGDDCQECDLDWSAHGPNGGPHLHHVDLWIGGQDGNAFDALNCEDALTRSRANGAPAATTFVLDPPPDLPVSSQPLFNPATGRCFGGAHAASSTGTYRNGATGRCLADTGPSATTAGCAAGDQVRITYDGSFLVHDRRCLKTAAGHDGSIIKWSACDGDAREQWEINANHTITWVQYTRCIASRDGQLVLAACGHGASERWSFRSASA